MWLFIMLSLEVAPMHEETSLIIKLSSQYFIIIVYPEKGRGRSMLSWAIPPLPPSDINVELQFETSFKKTLADRISMATNL